MLLTRCRLSSPQGKTKSGEDQRRQSSCRMKSGGGSRGRRAGGGSRSTVRRGRLSRGWFSVGGATSGWRRGRRWCTRRDGAGAGIECLVAHGEIGAGNSCFVRIVYHEALVANVGWVTGGQGKEGIAEAEAC